MRRITAFWEIVQNLQDCESIVFSTFYLIWTPEIERATMRR